MDANNVTILVSSIAAVTSLLSLYLNVNSNRKSEIRELNRKRIEPLVEDLSSNVYTIIAAIVLLKKDKNFKKREYWNRKIQTTQYNLRQLRYKVRYPLWGLDDAIRTLLLLPGLFSELNENEISEALTLATRLRRSIDFTIRRCYNYGRTPNFFERYYVEYNVRRILKKWDKLKEIEAQQFEIDFGKKHEAVYPKIYAKVVKVNNETFIAQSESGQQFEIGIRAKSGKGSSSEIAEGKEIKIFKRPYDKDYHYRFKGG